MVKHFVLIFSSYKKRSYQYDCSTVQINETGSRTQDNSNKAETVTSSIVVNPHPSFHDKFYGFNQMLNYQCTWSWGIVYCLNSGKRRHPDWPS
ncbi:hypothetical protein TNCV_4808201 [Trichonephila clavipes]|nr:hypothetical protein TNCV_4808201 [Trichonephila clavipes]